MISRLPGLFVALILLAGCAGLPEVPARPPVAEITTFAFNGRVAVRQGERRHHARIDWRHDAAGDQVVITTPLGQGVAEIARDPDGARLMLADRRTYVAADWEQLAEQVFGVRLPLAGSERWLLGNVGTVSGWRLTVLERESAAPDALPALIELEREEINVRIKIDEWSEVR